MKNKPIKIDLVSGESEWQGLYVNGKLVEENHSLSCEAVLRQLADLKLIQFVETYVSQEYLDDQGNLPDLLSDIPKEVVE